MSEGQGVEVEVFETKRFTKSMDALRLSDDLQELVDNEIDRIIENPEVGTQKKGDLSYLWVHKFKIKSQELLLGYSWIEDRIELYLLNLGSHENFYKEMRNRRKADLKIIGK